MSTTPMTPPRCRSRSATARNSDLALLFTPPCVGPPPLAQPDQAVTILDAASTAGLNDIRLRELTLVLGNDPEEHDISEPTISENAADTLDEAADR